MLAFSVQGLGKRRLARIIRRELDARDQQCAFTHMLETVAVRNIEAITFHRPHAPMFAALAFIAARTRGLLVGLRVRRPLRWHQPADMCGMISLWAANRPSLRILDSRPALFLA